MTTNANKRAAIYAVSFMPVEQANVNNTLGFSSIRVQGAWHKLSASKIEFQEKQVNDGFEVSLKIRITDTSNQRQHELISLCSDEVLCLLRSTDCLDRVLGTDDVPVTFKLTKKDLPSYYELEYRGTQPEMAKLLQSF